MARRQFPIGEQDFANIRNRNMVYIDKTHLIYKFESGTPTALVETMQRNDYSLEHLTNEVVSSQLMSSVDSDEVSPIPLIYQSGYLTIKGYDEEFGNYLLGFPNKEVSEGFTRYLMPYYSPVKRGQENFFVSNFVKVKINSTADAALQQIEDKQYAKPFANTDKTIYKIGVNFSTETRRIDEWKYSLMQE